MLKFRSQHSLVSSNLTIQTKEMIQRKNNDMGKEISLYIHVPFCVKKCLYCDFLSFNCEKKNIERYFEALITEIVGASKVYKDYSVKSMFFGGGTPSFVDSGLICMALSTIKESFCMKKDAEISIEVNPASAIIDKLTDYKKAGINRISIGAQSLNDKELKKLGRVHNKEMFLETFENARKAGFENINVDIMSALPDQSFDSYMSTLNRIVALKPQHISAYSLIIEEGTPFYNMDLHLPDEELDRKMYHATKAFLAKQGYHRYEISNYALNSPKKETFECCHNKVYWKRGNYLGLGLGAASMVENVRWNNTSDFDKYITFFEHVKNTDIFHDVINEPLAEGKLKQTEKDVLHENIEFLDKKSRMEEFMFLGLRLIEGISIKEFKEVFNCDIFEIYGPVINKYTDMGLLEYSIDEDYLRLTEKGLDVSNTVMADFLLD